MEYPHGNVWRKCTFRMFYACNWYVCVGVFMTYVFCGCITLLIAPYCFVFANQLINGFQSKGYELMPKFMNL